MPSSKGHEKGKGKGHDKGRGKGHSEQRDESMIDLTGIFQGLLEFFEVLPNGTRNQFVNALVAREIATVDEANLWIDKFLGIGEGMALIGAADFDVLMAKARDAGLERASNGARAIFDKLVQLVDFRIQELQGRLDSLRLLLAGIEVQIPLVAQGRIWIEANAPGSVELKAAVLAAIDTGATWLENDQHNLEHLIEQAEIRIEGMGGTPT